MIFLPFLAIIMRGQRTAKERPEYSLTVLSNGLARAWLSVATGKARYWPTWKIYRARVEYQ